MRFLLRFVVDHNPLYVLSALSMFSGCSLLIRALALQPGETGKLIALWTASWIAAACRSMFGS